MRYGTSDFDSPENLAKLSPQMSGRQEAKEQQRKLWLADWQIEAEQLMAREMLVTGGRGTGKTTFLALRLIHLMQSIYRGLSLVIGPSQKSLQAKTFPQLVKAMEQQYGIVEGIHFFRGQPPAKLHWAGPLAKPRVWENVVSTYTGHCFLLISTSQTAAANGVNSCALIGDEYRFLDENVLFGDVLPTLRGDSYTGKGWNKETNPLYLSQLYLSDAGVTHRQRRLQERIEKSIAEDEEAQKANNLLADMVADLRTVPELAQLPKFCERLNKVRCKARLSLNYSSLENIASLGEDFIRRCQLTMPDLLFRVQILGQRLANLGASGYYNYQQAVHGYMPNGERQTEIIEAKMMRRNMMRNGELKYEWESPDLEETSSHAEDCILDDDLRPDLPLRIAFDCGHDFNCVVIGQIDEKAQPRTLRIINAMYVKNGPRLETLVRNLNHYYRYQRMANPDIIFYTDSTMRQGGSYATEMGDKSKFENVIRDILVRCGWKVHTVNLSRPMMHNVKYQYLGEVFGETASLHVRINLEQCDFLCLAIEQCEAKQGPKGIMKDKSQEKLRSEEGKGQAREVRSDITDAMDTLIIGCGRYTLSGQSTAGGLFGSVYLSRPKIR